MSKILDLVQNATKQKAPAKERAAKKSATKAGTITVATVTVSKRGKSAEKKAKAPAKKGKSAEKKPKKEQFAAPQQTAAFAIGCTVEGFDLSKCLENEDYAGKCLNRLYKKFPALMAGCETCPLPKASAQNPVVPTVTAATAVSAAALAASSAKTGKSPAPSTVQVVNEQGKVVALAQEGKEPVKISPPATASTVAPKIAADPSLNVETLQKATPQEVKALEKENKEQNAKVEKLEAKATATPSSTSSKQVSIPKEILLLNEPLSAVDPENKLFPNWLWPQSPIVDRIVGIWNGKTEECFMFQSPVYVYRDFIIKDKKDGGTSFSSEEYVQKDHIKCQKEISKDLEDAIHDTLMKEEMVYLEKLKLPTPNPPAQAKSVAPVASAAEVPSKNISDYDFIVYQQRKVTKDGKDVTPKDQIVGIIHSASGECYRLKNPIDLIDRDFGNEFAPILYNSSYRKCLTREITSEMQKEIEEIVAKEKDSYIRASPI